MNDTFSDLQNFFAMLVDQGFNPVDYTIEGRTFVVINPADVCKDLYTVPAKLSMAEAMAFVEKELKRYLLATKQYEYIKRRWLNMGELRMQERVELLDDVDHTCLQCNRTIPAWNDYWGFGLTKQHMDEPGRDFLIYCDQCVTQQLKKDD